MAQRVMITAGGAGIGLVIAKAFTKSLAVELGPFDVRVNASAPARSRSRASSG